MVEILNNLKNFCREQKELKNRPQTNGEEIFNAVTHGVGALLSTAALVLMVVSAVVNNKDCEIIAGVSIFGATSIVLYLVSALYHSLSKTRARDVFKVFDHSAIFILIAGYIYTHSTCNRWGLGMDPFRACVVPDCYGNCS